MNAFLLASCIKEVILCCRWNGYDSSRGGHWSNALTPVGKAITLWGVAKDSFKGGHDSFRGDRYSDALTPTGVAITVCSGSRGLNV